MMRPVVRIINGKANGSWGLQSFSDWLRISVNVTAHFANNVTGGFTRLRGV